ncbi:hypothetical protein METHP15_950014 [Pseudomonas sp. P15-2025]
MSERTSIVGSELKFFQQESRMSASLPLGSLWGGGGRRQMVSEEGGASMGMYDFSEDSCCSGAH